MQFAVAGLADASVMREGEDMFTLDPSVIISRQRENLSKIHTKVCRWTCSYSIKTQKTHLLVCSSHLPLVVCVCTQCSCSTDVPTYMQTDLNINGRYMQIRSLKKLEVRFKSEKKRLTRVNARLQSALEDARDSIDGHAEVRRTDTSLQTQPNRKMYTLACRS